MASGVVALRRLLVLHNVYAPAGRRLLVQAGIRRGMKVADFGCGVGAVTRMMAEMVGSSGSVMGIDSSEAQVEQATDFCRSAGLTNVEFRVADACNTGLPRESFDMVYCRFLLLHLPDPAACLREMRDVLKPGGTLVIEDGDLASASSVPPTALNAFADLFTRLGPTRGLNYSLANNLFHMVRDAGFTDAQIEIHQPAGCSDENGTLLTMSVAEAGRAFINAGLITPAQLESTIRDMAHAANNPEVLALAPRMSMVWARKAAWVPPVFTASLQVSNF